MALSWNLQAVKDQSICWVEATEDDPNHGIVKGEKYMSPVTNALIWSTIAVDLPGITEDNAGEFFARLRLWERTFGAFLIRAEVDGKRPEGAAAFITEAEVLAHVGLTCNVSPVSRAKWLKRFDSELSTLVARFEKKRGEVAIA